MSTQQTKFGAASSALVVTNLHSLASSATAGWASAAQDNSVLKPIGWLITVTLVVGAGTPGAEKTAYVYVYESEDGTNYDDPVTGTQGTLTRLDPTNMKLIDSVAMPNASTTYKKVVRYVPAIMPLKWGVYINNVSNIALAGSGNSVTITPILGESV